MSDEIACEDRAAWYGRRPPAAAPQWNADFLAVCQAAGSIIDCQPEDRSAAAVWARVIALALVCAAAVGALWLFTR